MGVAVVAAAATIAVAVTNNGAAPSPAPVAVQVASRAGIVSLQVDATAASAVLWASRGYTYNVELANGTTTPLDIVDVTSLNSGTELVWNQPLTLPASGTAHLRVDFLVTNCAAVAVAPAPSSLRLTLRAHGTSAAPGVADVSVVAAGEQIDGSTKPLCPAPPPG